MKVVFTADGTGLSSPTDPRFGRCAGFVLVDTDSMAVQSHPNPSRQAAGGAGIQAGQFVAALGAQAVVTGQVGPNAARVLKAAGIRIFVGAAGAVQEALDAFRAGKLSETDAATVETHSGMGGKR